MQIFPMRAIFFVYKSNSFGVGVLRHAPLSGNQPGLILVFFLFPLCFIVSSLPGQNFFALPHISDNTEANFNST